MNDPENGNVRGLPQCVAAPQRERGPHPLSTFLGHASEACAGDPARLRRVLAGLRRYQDAPAPIPRPARPVVAQASNALLRDYGTGAGAPVVVVPSLINPPTVLDLAPGNSLLAALATAGLRPLLVDWGTTEPAGLAELVETRLVPLVESLGEPVAMAGYCLGGTLSLGAASLLGPKLTKLALLATPWHFSGYGHGGVTEWWESAGPLATLLGAVPMDLLQPMFWSLDAPGLAAKYERLAGLPDGPALAAFVALEDWSNTGQPLSLAAAREMAEDLFAADLPGRGAWIVGGRPVDPGALGIPILDIIAGRDRVVPPAAALSTKGPGTPLLIDAGHVGMVVGGRGPELLWKPLATWLLGQDQRRSLAFTATSH
jgi:polyhydroxyalkanoate synthase